MGNYLRASKGGGGHNPIMAGWLKRTEQALEQSGLDMKAASRAAGQNETFVRDLLRRGRKPNIDAFLALASAIKAHPSWLLTGEGPNPLEDETIDVPLLSKISASTFKAQDGVRAADIDRHIKVSHLPKGKWFALTVEGTSMDRVAPDGSIIIVNQADDILLDGKAYVFSLDDGAATFKQYRLTPEPMLTPYSWHPEHYAMPVGDKDLYVFGRVRRVITDL